MYCQPLKINREIKTAIAVSVLILSVLVLAGSAVYAASAGWVTGKFNNAYDFNGQKYIDIGNVSNSVKTVAFWVSGTGAGAVLNLSDTVYVSINSNTVTATGFTSPTIYIDGTVGSTVDSNWHFVAVTDTAAVNASAVKFGSLTPSYLTGAMDDVKMYNYALSAREINELYRQKSPSLALGGTVNGNMYVMGAGQLGIGTSTPSAQFAIAGTAGVTALNIASSTGASMLMVDQYGNVGIGTSTPNSRLNVYAAANKVAQFDTSVGGGMYQTFANQGTVFGYIGSGSQVFSPAGLSTDFSVDAANTNLVFGTVNVERMRISGANVGIGTSSPASLLEISSSTASPILTITNNSATNTYDPTLQFRLGAGPTTAFKMYVDDSDSDKLKIATSTADVLTITQGGYVGIGAAATSPTHLIELDSDTYGTVGGWADGSDRNKKENFTDLTVVSLPSVQIGTWSGNGSTIPAIDFSSSSPTTLNQDELLNRLEMMPIMRWNFITDGDTNKLNPGQPINHIGPTAQDFNKLFGLGPSDTNIRATDMAGVSLAGIKALSNRLNPLYYGISVDPAFSPLTPSMTISGSGNVGIGTSTPDAKLEVVGGAVCIDTAEGLECNMAGTAGDIYYQAAHSNWTDVAEAYPSQETLEPGDVVVLDSNMATSSFGVKRSTTAYADDLVGVVSTQPGVILGDDYGKSVDTLIAISGRVPVKISLENGPIMAGDFLTSSTSTPGTAMKATSAGRVIGMALQSANGNIEMSTSTSSESSTSTEPTKIMMLVNPHYQGNDLSVQADPNGQIVQLDPAQLKAGLFSIGLEVGENGYLTVEKLKAKKLEVGTTEKPVGITVYDADTGNPFCIIVKSGAMQNLPGVCENLNPSAAAMIVPANDQSSIIDNSSSTEPVATTTESTATSTEPSPSPNVEISTSPDTEPVATSTEPVPEPELVATSTESVVTTTPTE